MEEVLENVVNLWSAVIVGLALGMLLYAYRKRKIDQSAIVATGVVGFLCLAAGGVKWATPLVVFFVAGNIASHHKRKLKKKLGVAQTVRTWRNVFANGGAAALFGLYCLINNDFSNRVHLLGLTAVMAVAMADTFGTELGQTYGLHPRLITTMKRVRIGTPGAITKEGLLFSLTGSAIISGLLFFWGYSMSAFIICFFCGFLGSVLDSVFGCTLEKIKIIDTHWNNLLTTFIGGIVAFHIGLKIK